MLMAQLTLDVVDIDGAVDMASTLQVDGAITSSAGMTITTADNTNQLTLVSTDEDGGSGPKLTLQRDSASPADGDVGGRIHFVADDDGGNTFEAALIDVTLTDVSNGNEDATLDIKGIVAGSEVKKVSFGAETVFNEDSADLDFRVESNSYTHALFVDAGNDRVTIGNASDAAGTLTISDGDAGPSATANANELVIEDNGNAGISILTPNDAQGSIVFGDSDNNAIGTMIFDHPTNNLSFNTSGGTSFTCIGAGQLSSKGENAPDVSAGGLTLQQGANDTPILTFKSSDVAHGITGGGGYETDSYARMKKNDASNGGLRLQSASESAISFKHESWSTGSNTAESGAATSNWCVDARLKNGTSVASLASDDNLASFRTADTAQFIIKGDGELFSNTTGTVGTFDAYEDAQLVRAYDLSHMKGVINSKFDKFVQYNKDDLQKARLIGTDDDGNATPMVNITGMQRLHNGAIWQQYEKTQRLTQAMYKLATKTLGKEEADKLLDEEEIKLLN